jgi:post-segregation antitoxin (ccd killing protein)
MAIDMKALAAAAKGNAETKVAVTRPWLAEVHRLLAEGERAKSELGCIRRQNDIFGAIFPGFGSVPG